MVVVGEVKSANAERRRCKEQDITDKRAASDVPELLSNNHRHGRRELCLRRTNMCNGIKKDKTQ